MMTPASTRTGIATWGPVAVTLGLIAVATLIPTAPSTGGDNTPFWCLDCGDYALADAVANVVLFVPLGWAMSRTGVRPHIGLAVVLTTTIGVESLQYAFVPGRVASLSDILTNTVGGVVGMALPSLRRTVVQSGRHVLHGALLYGALLSAGLGVGAATQAVRLPRTLRWTEGSLESPDYVPFTGSVRVVRVDATPVALHAWVSVPRREVVDIEVDFLSGRPDTGLAQVIIGWLPRGGGWMWLEQRDRDLRVHLASASDRSRLRGHSAWLGASLPAKADEPVMVRLIVRPFAYRIVVATNAGEVVRDASITLGDGWRMFTPFERTEEPWASLLTAGWMAALLGPLGYLASVRSRGAGFVAAVGAGVGLLMLPIVLACGWLHLPGWCGTASGFLVGSYRRARGEARDLTRR